MSLYNMINGVNPATFFILPVFGKHPDAYPRFRDCGISEKDGRDIIQILTRTGGGNREGYQAENEELKSMTGYIEDQDADWDETYAVWSYEVPEEFKSDISKIMAGKIKEIGPEYKKRLYEVYPKLKDTFDKLFNAEQDG